MKRLHRIALRIVYRLLKIYWFLFRPKTGGAYIAVWHREQILVIRNSYKPGWTLPAGAPKRRESIEETAIRELQEEVGIVLRPSDLTRSADRVNLEEYKYDECAVFETRMPTRPQIKIDETEVVEAKFIDLDQAAREIGTFNSIARQYLESKIKLKDNSAQTAPH